jgi:hypothetical protein
VLLKILMIEVLSFLHLFRISTVLEENVPEGQKTTPVMIILVIENFQNISHMMEVKLFGYVIQINVLQSRKF